MTLVVENESVLPITVTEKDVIAGGTEEGAIPTLDSCAAIQGQQEKFCQALDWVGSGEDTEREVTSPRADRAIVVVVHMVPHFSACSTQGLRGCWRWESSDYEDHHVDLSRG